MIAQRLEAVRARIAAACARVGRDPADVQLIAASKRVPPSVVREAYDAGLRSFGESYVQEWQAKAEAPPLVALPDLRWHFIGRLQRNKIKFLLGRVACIQTVDRRALAEELSRRGEVRGAPETVLLQVNVGEELNKAGFTPNELRDCFWDLAALPGLRIDGLMAIPPVRAEVEETRPDHASLRHLRDDLGLRTLSTGMSRDFEVAIEEGATIVRVGTALFGPRG